MTTYKYRHSFSQDIHDQGFGTLIDGTFSRALKKLAVFIMADLPAALQLALNQQHLLALRQLEQFIGGNTPYDIRKILRHPVVLDSEDLDYAGIIDERTRLRDRKSVV